MPGITAFCLFAPVHVFDSAFVRTHTTALPFNLLFHVSGFAFYVSVPAKAFPKANVCALFTLKAVLYNSATELFYLKCHDCNNTQTCNKADEVEDKPTTDAVMAM